MVDIRRFSVLPAVLLQRVRDGRAEEVLPQRLDRLPVDVPLVGTDRHEQRPRLFRHGPLGLRDRLTEAPAGGRRERAVTDAGELRERLDAQLHRLPIAVMPGKEPARLHLRPPRHAVGNHGVGRVVAVNEHDIETGISVGGGRPYGRRPNGPDILPDGRRIGEEDVIEAAILDVGIACVRGLVGRADPRINDVVADRLAGVGDFDAHERGRLALPAADFDDVRVRRQVGDELRVQVRPVKPARDVGEVVRVRVSHAVGRSARTDRRAPRPPPSVRPPSRAGRRRRPAGTRPRTRRHPPDRASDLHSRLKRGRIYMA